MAHLLRRLVQKTAAQQQRHGVWWTIIMLAAGVLRKVCGVTVFVCAYKKIDGARPGTARRLEPSEIDAVARDSALGVSPSFVQSVPDSLCYGVEVEGRVRAYVWAASGGEVPVVPGTAIEVPRESVYVYKAFTEPSARGRGLLGECLATIERDGWQDGRRTLAAVIEPHNRNSRSAFRRAGFEECGYVVTVRRPWHVTRLGCRCDLPCLWQQHRQPPRQPVRPRYANGSLPDIAARP